MRLAGWTGEAPLGSELPGELLGEDQINLLARLVDQFDRLGDLLVGTHPADLLRCLEQGQD